MPAAAAPDVTTPRKQNAWTILEVLRWTTSRFTERGLESPRLDAELLAAHAFGMPRVQLYAQFDRPLQPEELDVFRELVRRRQAGEPVAYLIGRKEFWSLELAVDPRVLIPRPDTETAVEEALARVPEGAPARLLDVGTGSGAIALALAKSRPSAEVLAVDRSPHALEVARANAERLGLRVTFFESDLLSAIPAQPAFDLVVANLPYVPDGEIDALAPEVRREPRLALAGGPDGLALVRGLLADAPRVLRPGGSVVLEIGAGQAAATATLCAQAGLVDVSVRRDLGGVDRVVAARAPR